MNAKTGRAITGTLVDRYGEPLTTTRENAIAELKAQVAKLQLRAAYDAAALTRENAKHWRFADDLSAAAANSLAVRKVVRSRSRYECLQSNSFGVGIVRTLANDFVSTGPRLHIETADRDLAQRIEGHFHKWARKIKLNKKLRTARVSKCVDGESFLIGITNPRLRCPVQLDIRGIESDQITTPGWIDGVKPGAVDGIRFDAQTGEPVEYDLIAEHPGDRGLVPTQQETKPLDARDVIHLFNCDRFGQWRGMPELTASLPLFAYLRRYTLATIASAEVAASFAAVLKTQVGAFDPDAGDGLLTPFDTVEIDRGMMAALPFGYELQQLKPEQPTAGYIEVRDAILCEIARPIGMPRNKVLGDSSPYNFSSTRADQHNYYSGIDVERQDWEVDALDKIFEWWLDEAVFIPGYIDLPPTAHLSWHWTWPQPQSVNPLQDATTAIKLIDAGLLLESDYLAQRQIDPETFFEARKRQDERKRRRLSVADLPPERPEVVAV